jgi:ornithine decarboxylase
MSKLENYCLSTSVSLPTLVIDLEKVKENFKIFRNTLPDYKIHYAVKANPNFDIIKELVELGSYFDTASGNEIKICLKAGADPKKISFGSTIKTIKDIKYSYKNGIKLFAADSEDELKKIEKHAPNSDVFIRVLLGDTGALRPLNKKFGCSAAMAEKLFEIGKGLNINIIGLSFHIGSQTLHPHMWFESLDLVSNLWNKLKNLDYNLKILNIGGGFPSVYDQEITDLPVYCSVIKDTIKQKFGEIENIFAEPGRAMVADAGIMIAESILVSQKDINDTDKWLYLNIGRFGGLYSTDGEIFKYKITAPTSNGKNIPYIVAGPTLHSADILYEKYRPLLPENIKSGDKILIHNTGAYTSVYSTRFNGFSPVKTKVIR